MLFIFIWRVADLFCSSFLLFYVGLVCHDEETKQMRAKKQKRKKNRRKICEQIGIDVCLPMYWSLFCVFLFWLMNVCLFLLYFCGMMYIEPGDRYSSDSVVLVTDLCNIRYAKQQKILLCCWWYRIYSIPPTHWTLKINRWKKF